MQKNLNISDAVCWLASKSKPDLLCTVKFCRLLNFKVD